MPNIWRFDEATASSVPLSLSRHHAFRDLSNSSCFNETPAWPHAHLMAASWAWDTAGGVQGFASRTDRTVEVDGRLFPTKAIVGLAHSLAAETYSLGEASMRYMTFWDCMARITEERLDDLDSAKD